MASTWLELLLLLLAALSYPGREEVSERVFELYKKQ